MALDNAALLEVLEAMQAGGVDDRVRVAAQTIYQALIDAELTSVIGAGPWERTDARTTQRNGSRPRTLTTTAGDLELRMPKLRVGSFFPSFWSGAGQTRTHDGMIGSLTRTVSRNSTTQRDVTMPGHGPASAALHAHPVSGIQRLRPRAGPQAPSQCSDRRDIRPAIASPSPGRHRDRSRDRGCTDCRRRASRHRPSR